MKHLASRVIVIRQMSGNMFNPHIINTSAVENLLRRLRRRDAGVASHSLKLRIGAFYPRGSNEANHHADDHKKIGRVPEKSTQTVSIIHSDTTFPIIAGVSSLCRICMFILSDMH